MNDNELLDGIRRKDETCYERLMEKYMRYVAAIIVKVSGQRLNSHDIEEICADVFIKIWLNSEKIKLKGDNIKAYLAVSAKNNTLNLIRDRRINMQELELDENVQSEISVEENILIKQANQEVKELVQTLQKTDREIMLRRYFNFEKVKDIANNIGMTEKAVSARISRSKNKLKELLAKKGMSK